jgi:hypothetical protein
MNVQKTRKAQDTMSRNVDTEERIDALAKHLKCDADDVEALNGQTQCQSFERGNAEYMVLTDDEANEMWNELLDSYIDDCILSEVPKGAEKLARYFDRDAWKRDARHDGRGHSLSPYDGKENREQLSDGTWLYIYRTN